MKKFKRENKNKIFGGVCSGLANFTNSDPIFWRVGFLALLLTLIPIGVIYLLLWFMSPKEEEKGIHLITNILEDMEKNQNIPKIKPNLLSKTVSEMVKSKNFGNSNISPKEKKEFINKELIKAQNSIIENEINEIQLKLKEAKWFFKKTNDFKNQIKTLTQKLK